MVVTTGYKSTEESVNVGITPSGEGGNKVRHNVYVVGQEGIVLYKLSHMVHWMSNEFRNKAAKRTHVR